MDWKDCELYVIDKEQISLFHKIGWGGEEQKLTAEHIKALHDGKCVAWSDGEYTHVLSLE